jgi:hypothetical protein
MGKKRGKEIGKDGPEEEWGRWERQEEATSYCSHHHLPATATVVKLSFRLCVLINLQETTIRSVSLCSYQISTQIQVKSISFFPIPLIKFRTNWKTKYNT